MKGQSGKASVPGGQLQPSGEPKDRIEGETIFLNGEGQFPKRVIILGNRDYGSNATFDKCNIPRMTYNS